MFRRLSSLHFYFTAGIAIMMMTCRVPLPCYSQNNATIAKAQSLQKQGEQFYNSFTYDKAQACFENAVTLYREAQEINNVSYGRCLYYLGLILPDSEKALDCYLQALPILEKNKEDDFLYCLGNIAVKYLDQGNYQKAIEYFEKKLANLDVSNWEYPSTLEWIGDCYFKLKDYQKALGFFEQSMMIRSKNEDEFYYSTVCSIGKCHVALNDGMSESYFKQVLKYEEYERKRAAHYGYDYVPDSAIKIANTYLEFGQYKKAITYFKMGLEDADTLYRPTYALSLYRMGLCYFYEKDFNTAISYSKQVRDLYADLDGIDGLYIWSLYLTGLCFDELNDYPAAMAYYEDALATMEKEADRHHQYNECYLHVVNSIHWKIDNPFDSITRALAYIEKTDDKTNPDYAECIISIASMLQGYDNNGKAIDLYERAMHILEGTTGRHDARYLECTKHLAEIYECSDNYSKAIAYCTRYLELYDGSNGDSPDYIKHILGDSYYNLAEYADALDYYRQEYEETRHRSVLECIGDCYYSMGLYSDALGQYQEFIDDASSDYEDLGVFMNTGPAFKRALSYYKMGNLQKCSDSFDYYSGVVEKMTSDYFNQFLSEKDRYSFWQQYAPFYTDQLFSYAADVSYPRLNQFAYDGALFGKGILLNAETRMRTAIMESNDLALIDLFNKYQSSLRNSDRLLDIAMRKNPNDSLAFISSSSGVETVVDSLSKELSDYVYKHGGLSSFGDQALKNYPTWKNVQEALGKKDIAIEFETYTRKDTTFYIALTLRSGYTEPHLVEMFNSTQMKAKSDSKTYYTSPAMSRLVWGSLSGELKGVENVYFSPSGELNNIGIEYMLDEDGKHLLSEKRNYYRLTSTRELVKEYHDLTLSDVTVYGGIRYDVTPGSKLTGKETPGERLAMTATRSFTSLESLAISRGDFKYLPGTKEEAESISSTLTSKRVKNELLEGAAGTEESFKALGGTKKDVIHIATHGFYWTEQEAVRKASSFRTNDNNEIAKEDKAMTRSGLLFAGAQNALEGKEIPIDVEDGILTAKDISRMDLRGTDLVVISACQSGLGEVTGDGVFGLQRGFKKAGVQSIVMSLWEVDDNATKLMMMRFYENLAKGRSKYDAFREAQKYLRKYENGRYDEPEYYAAFVLLDAIK